MSEPSQILKVLKKYNQEHLLNFWSELNEDQKQSLQNQLNSIDFAKVDKLYKSLKTISIPQGEIVEPLDYFIKNEFSAKERRNLENQGTAMLKSGQYAVVTMAGGQGTRLGHKGPKGTFELNLFPKKESLFEILANKIKKANKRYNIEIPWYIMTSETNNGDTISFFESKNYFGYDKEKIKFFIQNKLPLVDTNGKILLSETYQVYEASNGNGNLFESLKENNMISDMKNRGIKWIFISGIDNILVKIADPIFLALTINNGTEIGAKTIFKKDPYSRDWVFCKKNSKPAMLGYERITDEITNANIDGRFLYREINILCHLFSIDALEKISNIDLPYHRATKKNTYINEEGMKIAEQWEKENPSTFNFQPSTFNLQFSTYLSSQLSLFLRLAISLFMIASICLSPMVFCSSCRMKLTA